ncbi:hypothetical protein EYF80_029602 [Liparis tanakae]|uniref:Uncharacterized protein n=1 Tax=Liparis tanakae TaxID=230148 RepID=A0A4Z2H330_9TELE|nr:hypothetical protein EYF80_029602 [Liparis tanakae]
MWHLGEQLHQLRQRGPQEPLEGRRSPQHQLTNQRTAAQGEWPGWSYSTTREKQLQGKSGPTCCSYTTTHTLSHTLAERREASSACSSSSLRFASWLL